MTSGPVTKQRRYKNPYAIVRAAKRLIDTGHWGKGTWVTTADGTNRYEESALKMDPATDGGVCKVCLEGALALCAASPDAYDAATALVQKKLPVNYRTAALFNFNDSRTEAAEISKVLEKTLLDR